MRVKKAAFEPVGSRDEMEGVVREICMLTIRRDESTARMDEAIARIRDQYQAELAEIGVKLDVEMDRAKDWAEGHPEEFAGKKSVAMVHGTIGFRTGMPQLKTLKGFTWKRVLETLKTAFPEYVRVKEEADKESMIADRDMLGEERLRRIGVRVSKDETFFVEPNREVKQKEVQP